MRKLMLVAALALAPVLGGCGVTGGILPSNPDDQFALACTAINTADVGFQLYASTGRVSASVIEAEATAVAAARGICDGPRPADAKSALAAINRALAAVAAQTAAARKQAGS